jgi:type I restriction enzyme, S subunit
VTLRIIIIIVDSLANQQFTFLTKCKSFEEKLNIKFFFYYMFIIDEWCKNNTNAGGFASVDMGKFKKYKFPIPPLPIQQEIVAILDKFTSLEAELKAELEARTRQYQYYRTELLNFEGKEVKWKTLGEVGKFVRGNGLQKKDFTQSGVGCIHYGQIYTYYGTCANKTKSFVSPEFAKKLRKAQKGDLIIATTSENVEDVCKTVVWLGDEEIAISGETYIFKHHQNAKYIAYYLQTPMFFEYKKQHITGTKVIRVSGDKLANFKIPIPSLSEQDRIVGILDKFDALVNDISVGLPAEIQARRKQYEYYRGKLLDFKSISTI